MGQCNRGDQPPAHLLFHVHNSRADLARQSLPEPVAKSGVGWLGFALDDGQMVSVYDEH
jgi:hypothetical protein